MNDCVWRVIRQQCLLAQAHGRIAVQARLERQVVNSLRIELLVDPSIHTHRLDPLDTPGPGPEGQTIEGLQSAFVGRKFCARDGLTGVPSPGVER